MPLLQLLHIDDDDGDNDDTHDYEDNDDDDDKAIDDNDYHPANTGGATTCLVPL